MPINQGFLVLCRWSWCCRPWLPGMLASSVVRTVKGLIRVGLEQAQGGAGAKDGRPCPEGAAWPPAGRCAFLDLMEAWMLVSEATSSCRQ